jgi:Protein of unknown function (DUF3043)
MSETQNEPQNSTGKGRPTPKRKEREAANIRPLVGNKSPEAKRAEKARLAAKRAEAREGLLNGDERYLGPRDKGPQRKFARDYVDVRYTGGELLLPVAFGAVILSSINNPYVQIGSTFVLWGFMILIGFNSWWVARGANKALEAKFGSVERGLKSYVVMRSLQMRPMRLPKPQVKRGAKIG